MQIMHMMCGGSGDGQNYSETQSNAQQSSKVVREMSLRMLRNGRISPWMAVGVIGAAD